MELSESARESAETKLRRVRRTKAQMVQDTLELHKDMNALTVEKIEATAPAAPEQEPQTKMSTKELAKTENCQYLEPIRKLPAMGTLPEKLKAEHKHAWEYVRGMWENNIVGGEPEKFWLCMYPGDPDCYWEVPANTPVYLPRHVAKRLETAPKYHGFKYVDKAPHEMAKLNTMERFVASETKWRGRFRAIGAFS